MTITTDMARLLFKALKPHFVDGFKKTTHLDGCTIQATLGFQVFDGFSDNVYKTNITFSITGDEATISS